MTNTTDELPDEDAVATDREDTPDQTSVRKLLDEGPHSPEGKIELGAAGLDRDDRGLVDETDASHPDRSGAVAPNTWSGDSPDVAGPPVDQTPLLSADTQQAFLDRWQAIQVSFVEDPPGSVRAAEALIGDIADAHANAFRERRDSLAAAWRDGEPGTEELRLALQQYRAFVGVALPKQG